MPLPSLDMVQQLSNRLIREQLDYGQEKEKENLDILLLIMNSDQMQVFQLVTHLGEHGDECFFIHISGRIGKMYIWKAIITYFRLKGLIMLLATSSDIAALLLHLGKTAHSIFKIPNDAD